MATQRAETGALPVVLLHDFALDARMWRPQVAALAPARRVVTVDLPGFGVQARPLGDAFAADAVERALSAAVLPRAHVVACGLGAACAIDLALLHPERVASLVLVGPWLVGHPHSLDAWDRCASLSLSGDVLSACELWLEDPTFDGLRRDEGLFDEVREIVLDYPGTHWRGGVSLKFHEPEPAGRLETLAVPTMVLRGEHEVPSLLDAATAYAKSLPDAEAIELENTGHFVTLEAPEAFHELLEDFVARVEGAPAASTRG